MPGPASDVRLEASLLREELGSKCVWVPSSIGRGGVPQSEGEGEGRREGTILPDGEEREGPILLDGDGEESVLPE